MSTPDAIRRPVQLPAQPGELCVGHDRQAEFVYLYPNGTRIGVCDNPAARPPELLDPAEADAAGAGAASLIRTMMGGPAVDDAVQVLKDAEKARVLASEKETQAAYIQLGGITHFVVRRGVEALEEFAGRDLTRGGAVELLQLWKYVNDLSRREFDAIIQAYDNRRNRDHA